jgi:hypothetical protein
MMRTALLRCLARSDLAVCFGTLQCQKQCANSVNETHTIMGGLVNTELVVTAPRVLHEQQALATLAVEQVRQEARVQMAPHGMREQIERHRERPQGSNAN